MSQITNLPTFSSSDWERYALCYDSLLHLTPYTNMLEDVAVKAHSKLSGKILDASCGTGNFEKILLELRIKDSFNIVGVDASLEMLERAKYKHEGRANVSFHEANLNSPLSFPDKHFSQVVSINTLYAVASPVNTLLEFHRVLNDGGELLLITPKRGYENGLILKAHCNSQYPDDFWVNAHTSVEREEKLIREAIKEEDVIANMLTVAKHNRNIVFNNPFHFYQQEELMSLLESVGFSVKSSSLTYADQGIFITAVKQ